MASSDRDPLRRGERRSPPHPFAGLPTITTDSEPSPNIRSAARRASAIVTAAMRALRSTSHSGPWPSSWMLHELAGDLGRGVEAQRIGADEVFLALFEFVLADAAARHVEDLVADHVERFVGALVLGRRAAVEEARRDRRRRPRRKRNRRGRASRAPRGTGARTGRCRRRGYGRARRWPCSRRRARAGAGRPKRMVDCGTSRSTISIAARRRRTAPADGATRPSTAGRSAKTSSISFAARVLRRSRRRWRSCTRRAGDEPLRQRRQVVALDRGEALQPCRWSAGA